MIVRRYEYAYMTQQDLVSHSVMEHAEIIDLIESGETERAGECLRSHWQRSFDETNVAIEASEQAIHQHTTEGK